MNVDVPNLSPLAVEPITCPTSDSDIRRLLQYSCDERLSGIWRLLAFGLLSVDEVSALEWSQVHVYSGRVMVRGVDRAPSSDNTSAPRVVALDHGTTAALVRLRVWRSQRRLALGEMWSRTNKVLVNHDGSPMTRSELEWEFALLSRAALLPHLTFADLAPAP